MAMASGEAQSAGPAKRAISLPSRSMTSVVGMPTAFRVEKTLAESRSRLDAGLAGRVDAALEAARTAVKGDDKDAITRAGDALQQASHAMAEALYSSLTLLESLSLEFIGTGNVRCKRS